MKMGRRLTNRICAINYPSRVEGWIDVCEVEGQPTSTNNLPWGPLYCVLQQDEQSFTAYCSEELSIFPVTPNKEIKLTDILFAELPRVRLDRTVRSLKALWQGPPTLEEEPEDGVDSFCDQIRTNTTLGSNLDTSYEKACRRGSAPATPILGQKSSEQSTSRFTNFFSKRSNPLKRTKSVTKLERSKRGPGGLRGSRSHESLLSSHAVMSTIDLSCTGAVGVAPVHQSVLGRRHCFQVRGGPRGERYYSCGSRQERDLWIYSLRKSIAPNADHNRRTDNSLKMWVYEAKALPPKKKYFCEINLDKTLYGRTSVKLRTDLLFWGEFFDFPDIPEINVITVNVFREGDKKKKRDKHVLVGCVKIPIHEVTSKMFCEDWYPIISEKHDSISRNSSKETIIPTLRIKCRFQSIDILPLDIYSEFLTYLKENYKKVCEILEPVIGVKAKEDIGQALVLLMQSQGMAGAFLTDVVALDLLRVGDQRLTFRGNSLATKSMEAFLKLTGEQYLQDTLSAPISEIISSDRDCEVDPLKATGSLSRQQQALRNAVKTAWTSIADSHKHFPPQLRECFATFRERLLMLDREDMADNLISASIFLRFLCPAILSPSLFNITNELPSARATRNLTLVAKTLQTLANFTRFQAKENFMEFMNDFLEQEATRMKDFLHLISTRSDQPAPDTILDWAGYIDQGKQLSILHTLLSESITKLSANRQQELNPLPLILEKIAKAKENTTQITINGNQENQPNNQNHPIVLKQNERGIIRGVLTPSSLEKNIFRYNDPTCSPLLNSHQQQNHSLGLQHSHSTSSITSAPSLHHQNLLTPTTPTTVQLHQHHIVGSSDRIQPQSPHKLGYNTSGGHYYNSSNDVKNSLLNGAIGSGGFRASTLPRNNGTTNGTINHPMVSTIDVEDNNNTNLIQIGLDTSNAFVRKSPTPLLKSICNGNNGLMSSSSGSNKSRPLNGSQLSLLSDRSTNASLTNNKNTLNLNLNLGIPHNDPILHHPHHHHHPLPLHANSSNNTTTFNMPMNLEDLDDLLKYADEQNEAQNKPQNKELLTTKGSNISIGQISNVCSSGYQSIATQSQSSSPVELTQTNQSHEYLGVGGGGGGGVGAASKQTRRTAPVKYQFGNTKATVNAICNNNISTPTQPQLAFKNPLYHIQNSSNSHSSQKSSSLTPSSSEERLSNENFCNIENGSNHDIGITGDRHPHHLNLHHPHHQQQSSILSNGGVVTINGAAAIGEIRGESDLSLVTASLNNVPKRMGSANRIPRTNPLMLYKREEQVEPVVPFLNSAREHNSHNHHHRYQRRLSLESARTLSDSSTDTEGLGHTLEGKRRRAPRSVEQCEREIQRLQQSVDSLRHKLEESDLRDSNDDLLSITHHSDSKMRSIISRLITMEEELRREQLKMSLALSHKQRVIEAQGQQIAALDAANNRLLSALSSLRQRYESQQSQPSGQSTTNGQASTTC